MEKDHGPNCQCGAHACEEQLFSVESTHKDGDTGTRKHETLKEDIERKKTELKNSTIGGF